MITLSITSVTDEIFALTALRTVVCPDQAAPPGILTRDQLPALRIMVRQAFATMVTRLLPYITDSSVDPDNPPAQRPYNTNQPVEMAIDFGTNTTHLTAGSMLVLRRYLEHILALDILERVYLPVDSAVASQQSDEASRLLATVEEMLTPPATPFQRQSYTL